ncbi:MAG: hypothetical protein JW786_14015 [Desulfobacterales bacterium]|nr:hypothetical protein [Desulfobacterales bacterium]
MFETLCSWENLLIAFRRASKGKRGHPNVAAFEHRLEESLLLLQRTLLDKSYRPGAYNHFYIHEPKKRLISAAPFFDRVVHHALCNLIEPIFENSFINESYANRLGKGTHRALNQVQKFSRKYSFLLQCDIRQFFPSIDHSIMRDLIEAKIDDPDVLRLIDRILESGKGVLADAYDMEGIPFLGFIVFPHRRRLKRRKGIYYRRKLNGMIKSYRAGQLPIERISASVLGWVNHVRYGNTVGLRKAILTKSFQRKA